ncbi:ATP-binding protein, partial [Uliginosibacterium sp. sgz301328]|uniref:HAMP domain-containing sensor histidine kinase n=1 Tax=Uliginosibacterium sp. sgz301328 TaxID=3243764 RepID=UPI00359D46D2
DAAGLEAYSARRALFLDAIARLGQHMDDGPASDALEQLSTREGRIWAQLQSQSPATGAASAGASAVIADFVAMGDVSESLVKQADARIEAEIAGLREQSAAARRRMLTQLWLLIPIGLLLAGGVILLIRRPIRQLGAGIRGLGEGQLDKPIRVTGPHDLEVLGAQLDWLRTRLAEVNAQKTRFLHHVSHELKTPLTAIHEGSQLLGEGISGPLTGEQREIVRILRDNTARLRRLIEDLLDYNGMRSRPARLRRERFVAGEVFSMIADDQKLALSARSLTLRQSGASLLLDADREKLRVILDNLVSNAIKFAPENSEVELSAHLGEGSALLEVADSGQGIAPELAQRMFEPFVQGPLPAGAPIKGTGLGLSIVKELVSAHGGEVELLPNQPCGTRVRVRLPQAAITKP